MGPMSYFDDNDLHLSNWYPYRERVDGGSKGILDYSFQSVLSRVNAIQY
jgi:hypothetical protein